MLQSSNKDILTTAATTMELSSVWNASPQLREWFQTIWLPVAKVWRLEHIFNSNEFVLRPSWFHALFQLICLTFFFQHPLTYLFQRRCFKNAFTLTSLFSCRDGYMRTARKISSSWNTVKKPSKIVLIHTQIWSQSPRKCLRRLASWNWLSNWGRSTTFAAGAKGIVQYIRESLTF